MNSIGFIGLGNMGRPMATNLLKKSGCKLAVYDTDIEKVNELAALGARVASSPQEVAAQSQIIITMLPSNEIVEAVIAGPRGIIDGICPQSVLIDMSSSSPSLIKKLSAKVMEKGAAMLDAPVSGGEPKAIDATLAIMVGGPEDIFQKVREILFFLGNNVTYIGPIGSGNIAKLANQIIVALNIAAVGEAFTFAAKAGIEPSKLYEAIKSGLAGSTVMDAKVPMIIKRNFKPGARMAVHIKDLQNALNVSHEIAAVLPLTAIVLEYMNALKAQGKENIDHGGLIQFYEQISNAIVWSID